MNKQALKDATDVYMDKIIGLIIKDLLENNEEYKNVRKVLDLTVDDVEKIHNNLSDTDCCILERFDDLKDRQHSIESRALLAFDKRLLREAL
ncbi:MAG: hypothetical protein FWF49_01375 [Oscillospiraceae bacterium]|nr:hypothetical protein [Oscillospiraceae bacterium]